MYNFDALLLELSGHPWRQHPSVVLTGPPEAGKTTVLGRFIRQARQDWAEGLLLHVDCREVRTEEELVQRALVLADEGWLPNCEAYLSEKSGNNVNISGFYQRASIKVVTGRRSRGVEPPDPARKVGVTALARDLRNLSRPALIAVDHGEEATDEVREFVDLVAPQLTVRSTVGLLRVRVSGDDERVRLPSAAGIDAVVYRLPALTVQDIGRWADELGLPLEPGTIDTLHIVSEGRAGRAWENFSRLALAHSRREVGGPVA